MSTPDKVRIPVNHVRNPYEMSRPRLLRHPERKPLIALVDRALRAMQADMLSRAHARGHTRAQTGPQCGVRDAAEPGCPRRRHGSPGRDHAAVDGRGHSRHGRARAARDGSGPRRRTSEAGDVHRARPGRCAGRLRSHRRARRSVRGGAREPRSTRRFETSSSASAACSRRHSATAPIRIRGGVELRARGPIGDRATRSERSRR